jgi:hypothetical protein
MPPSRDQLSAAIRKLDSATIRGKLAAGELTPLARSVAEEILVERERDGTEVAPVKSHPPEEDPVAVMAADFARKPFGWSWGAWAVATLVFVPIVASFGSHARNPGDQAFLYAVILLQSLILAGILRGLASVFTSSGSLGLLGKVFAVGVLLFAMGALTVCSLFAQSGWRGG